MSEPLVHIVDDDEAVRDSIKELVNSVGMKAETFENAKALLDVINHNTCGCIVLDIRMEGMSGLSLHNRLIEGGSTDNNYRSWRHRHGGDFD